MCVSQKADMLMDPRGARGLLSNWTDSGPHWPNYQLLLLQPTTITYCTNYQLLSPTAPTISAPMTPDLFHMYLINDGAG